MVASSLIAGVRVDWVQPGRGCTVVWRVQEEGLCSLPLREDRSSKEVLQVRDSSKDGEYWEALAHVIPEPTLKLWDALEVALKEYYNVLKRRAKLLAEAAVLQQQNSELSMMLEKFITSGANSMLLSSPVQ
ncbi:dynein regulatory complex protein 1-like [Cyrtonyx montezumae]|uniref:dynein regulatory complex protein 1-like n=1 Tax=Cyrtonyx montezumae TaxID=9017 RepID=UPI0032DBCD9E